MLLQVFHCLAGEDISVGNGQIFDHGTDGYFRGGKGSASQRKEVLVDAHLVQMEGGGEQTA